MSDCVIELRAELARCPATPAGYREASRIRARIARIIECDAIREKQSRDRMRKDAYARAGFPA